MTEAEDAAPRQPAAPGQIGELFASAQLLLRRAGYLGAAHALHVEVVRRAAPGFQLPERYGSLAEARRCHRRLLAEWQSARGEAPPSGRLRQLWLRRPAWFARAAWAALAALLVLRYAWAVTRGKNWSRQNPEGNWISRFYSNERFEGYPLVRYDAGANLDFGEGGPARKGPRDNFSVRWDTCLVVAAHTVVPLELTSDDGSKLFLDGQLQAEVEPGPGHTSLALALQPGLRHLRLEFVERAGMALIRLDGFELDGTDAYRFRRPVIEGNDVRCPAEDP